MLIKSEARIHNRDASGSLSEVCKSGDGDVPLAHDVVQPLDVCPRARVARPQPPGLRVLGLGFLQFAS